MQVPSEVTAQAAQSMLATLYQELAKLEVQQVTNGHQDTDHYAQGITYAQRATALNEAVDRLIDRYPDVMASALGQ